MGLEKPDFKSCHDADALVIALSGTGFQPNSGPSNMPRKRYKSADRGMLAERRYPRSGHRTDLPVELRITWNPG